jgi:hypothetical protein
MLRVIGFAAALTVPAAANCAPVMLNCELPTQNDGLIRMDVQLNEEAGTASYTFPDNGRSYTFNAIFAPDHVSFNAFWISRADMTFKRINNGPLDQEIYHRPPVEVGKCSLDTRKRAF